MGNFELLSGGTYQNSAFPSEIHPNTYKFVQFYAVYLLDW